MADSTQNRSQVSYPHFSCQFGRRSSSLGLALVLFLTLCSGLLGQGPAGSDREDLYLILLKEPSAAERIAAEFPGELRSAQATARDPRVEGYRRDLREGQRRFLNRVSSASLREVGEGCSYLINGVFVRTSAERVETLRNDAEVRKIFRSAPRYPVLDAAAKMIGAPDAWQSLGGIDRAGEGIRIGIIDSGINQEHTMFRDDGMVMPRGFPKGDVPFTTNKVIAARSFWEYFPSPPSQPADRTPEDQQGHGTRVASIAAGRVTVAPLATIQGIAPMAYLGNYKVFGTGGNSTTTSQAVVKAIEQAGLDGMDVINLSLGGPRVDPEEDPESIAIANAIKLGIVVVVAAGNEGPDAETVTSPGTSPDAITVGAVSNQRVFSPGITVTGSGSVQVPDTLKAIPYTAGGGITISSDTGPYPVTTLGSQDPQGLACSPLQSASLNGKIALVKRGSCYFQVKADNVFAAGAEAIIVSNNEDSGTIIMAFDKAPAGPAVMIEKTSGEALRELVNAAPSLSIQTTIRNDRNLTPFPVTGDEIASFSGRGPGINEAIKPDLVAIGTLLYTASQVTGQFALDASGTSFSSPMVAGAAALLRQMHPTWSSESIKSALVNTAVKTPTVSGGSPNSMQMGNGRLDLSLASQVTSVLNPVSVSFGSSVLTPGSRQVSLTLSNLWAGERQYTLVYRARTENPSVHISISPSTLTLAGGQSAQVLVTAAYNSPLVGGAFEGYLAINDKMGSPEVTAPIWGALLRENPEITLLVSRQPPGAYSTLEDALLAAGPGNVIEFGDSSVYAIQSTISTNGQGLPLNGLTIRAREGAHPVLDGTGLAPSLPVLLVRDVKRVSLEGLEIRGGHVGVSFENASGTVKDCIIETTADSPTSFGVDLWDGSNVHVYGNTIRKTAGAAISVESSQSLIQGNSIGDPDSTLAIRGMGIDAYVSEEVGIFDNLIIGGDSSQEQQGILFYSSSGIAKGNEIINFTGTKGDGIQIRSGGSHLDMFGSRLVGNERSGLALVDGATAVTEGNRLSENAFAGFMLLGGSTLTAAKESLIGNQNGVVVTDSTLQLTDSLVAFSPSNGVRGLSSSMTLLNDTVFGNGGTGVSSVSPQSNRLVNSIVSTNTAGDLSGISSSSTSYSLIGDNEFAGSNGNKGGNAGLADPPGGDFTPQPGSPAIDSGDNQQAEDSQTDLPGHVRIVDGDSNGSSIVDMGAVEGSSPHAPPLVVPLPALSSNEFVGVALTSTRTHFSDSSDAPIQVKIDARDGSTGSTYGSQLLDVAPLGQKARLASELVSNPRRGWLEILTENPGLVGFTLTGDFELTRLDGIALPNRPASQSILTEVRATGDARTDIYLVNPNNSAVTATVRWVRTGGPPISQPATITARGMLSASVQELFGSGEGGYLVIETPASLPVYAFELFGTPDALGALVGQPVDAASNRLYGAQLAASPGIASLVNVVNVSGVSASVTFDVYRETGEKVGAVSKSVSLKPGEQLRADAGELLGIEDFVGWLRVSTLSAGLLGSVSFQDPDGRVLAGLPLQAWGARESVLGHVAQSNQIFTGITVLNPSLDPALLSLEVFDSQGNLVGTALKELGGLEKSARVLPEWIPGLVYQVEGFIRIRANRPVIAFELFGSTEYLAAVPQQVLIR